MRRRILISVTNDISYDQRMQKTAMTLIQAGYDVKIVGRLKTNSIPIANASFQTHRFNLLFKKGKLFYLEYNIRLALYLVFSSYDILCAVDLDTIIPNVLIGKLKGKPIIYDAHEYFTEVPELANRNFEKSIWKWIEKLFVPQCNKMYTVGEELAKIFTNEYHIPCEVIYNFPKLQHNNPIPSKDRFIIIYQGDLNEGRGVDVMIEALVHIPDVEFWIAGDGYQRNTLEKLTAELLLASRVKFLGYIIPVELIDYTLQASLGINLLENKGLNHFYSLANKFFDYVQCRIPVLTMNFPEYQRLNDQYQIALLIDQLEVQEIITSIKKLVENKNIYQELVKNCDIARLSLNWESQEERLCSIYHDV